MSNNPFERLAAAVDAAQTAAERYAPAVSENEASLALTRGKLSSTDAQALVQIFAPVLDTLQVGLTIAFQEFTAKGRLLSAGQFQPTEWETDDSYTPGSGAAAAGLPETIAMQAVWQRPKPLPVDQTDLWAWCSGLEQQGVKLRVEIAARMEKKAALQRLQAPPALQVLFFWKTGELVQFIDQSHTWTALEAAWLPPEKTALLLLVGDSCAAAVSPFFSVIGRSAWNADLWEKVVRGIPEDKELSEVLDFRLRECVWLTAPARLTPLHFHLSETIPPGQKVRDAGLAGRINDLCTQTCLAYLGQRVNILSDGSVDVTLSHDPHIQVKAPPVGFQGWSAGLFSLFQWAYDGFSSDKISIARRVAALRMGRDADQNFRLLLEPHNMEMVYREVNANYEFLRKKSVEAYFERRSKYLTAMREFNDKTRSAIGDLAGGLVTDLFKTLGIVLGVLLAAVVDQNITLTAIRLSALFYGIYITFILAVQLSSIYLRYNRTWSDLRRTLEGIQEIFTETESAGVLYQHTRGVRWVFRVYFVLCHLVYALLAGAALKILLLSTK